MFADVTADHMRQMLVRTITREEFMGTMEKLREYTNESFRKVHKRFGLKCPCIPPNWSTRY
jgi:hypothetical protein